MIPAKIRSKRAKRIQRYFGVLVGRESHDPEFLFCNKGLAPPLFEGPIRVVLSPLEEERLLEIKSMLKIGLFLTRLGLKIKVYSVKEK